MTASEDPRFKEFFEWVLRVDGERVKELCEQQLEKNPGKDPFLVRDEVLLSLHKFQSPHSFGKTRFNS